MSKKVSSEINVQNVSIIHSPHEIISTAGKTGHDARWKWKQS